MATTDEDLCRELLSPTVTTAEVRRQLGLTADDAPGYRAIPCQRQDAVGRTTHKESRAFHATAG